MEAVTKFTLDVSSEEAAQLRAAVKTKLSELIGNDTDDVLVEYVVVLVSHGKQQSQAIVDLEAFLGDESTAFVTWLWDHLTTNKHLYMRTKEDNHLSMDAGDEDVQLVMEIEPETKQLNGHSGRTLASVIAVDEGATAVFDTETEDGAAAAFKGTRSESQLEVGYHSMKRGQHGEKSYRSESKRVRSPEIWTRKGRGRPDMIEMSPPDVKASRRLLISAVREAVAGSALLASSRSATQKAESALKHLPSVVSTDVDVQERGIEMVDADANMRNMQIPDVSLESQIQQRPTSVWDRLGVKDNERLSNDEFLGRVVTDDDMGEGEPHKAFADGARIGAEYSEYTPRRRKVPERKNRNGRMDHVYLGGKHQNYKSGLEENGQLLGSALNASLEQGLPLQTDTHSRSQMWVDSHPLESYNPAYNLRGMNDNGIIAKREFEEADDGKTGFYSQPNPNDVVEMKKRLRQVQLEMTKLRARQAEVSKEVQNAPISGVRPLPVQPSQEDINARSIFVSNVHFAATKAALNVHFGDCGEIVRVTLLGDVATGKPKGSAYVEFSTKEAVEKALALNESSLLSRTLKVVRKDAAAVEMITLPIVRAPMQRPHQRPFSRDSLLRGKLHMLQRPAGIGKHFSGTSHLQWKREESLTGASPKDAVATAIGERFGHGPVRMTRSLSYVRVAPYAMH